METETCVVLIADKLTASGIIFSSDGLRKMVQTMKEHDSNFYWNEEKRQIEYRGNSKDINND